MKTEFILLPMMLTILFIIIPLYIFNLREQRQHIWQAILAMILVLLILVILLTYKIIVQ